MNDVLFDYLDDFCTAYLDDIMIYSDNELEHEEHVCKVLLRLCEAGLQANIKKSEFSVKHTVVGIGEVPKCTIVEVAVGWKLIGVDLVRSIDMNKDIRKSLKNNCKY